MRAIASLTVTLLFMALGAVTALAETLPSPVATPVLVVSGEISVTNRGETAALDMGLLSDFPTVEFTTTTIWTQGPQTFRGVPLAAILERLGASGDVVRASAINNYSVEIPVKSLEQDAPIVAFSLNGQPMSRRQKGPLWVVYPYDKDPALRSEVVYARSIWQLDRIEIAH